MKWFKRKNMIITAQISQKNGDTEPVRPYGNYGHIERNHAFLYSLLVLFVVFFLPIAMVQSAPVIFTQNDWYTQSGVTADTPPFTGWNSYLSIDAGVISGADIQLLEDARLMTQTSDDGASDSCNAPGCVMPAGFNDSNAAFSQTAIEDTGSAAKIALDTTSGDGSYMPPFNISDPNSTSNEDSSANPEQATSIAYDSTHLYIAGYDYASSSGGQWRIEKRDIFNGNKTGLGGSGMIQINKNAEPEAINAIAIDNASIYAAGYVTDSGSDEMWRLEKRDKNTGNLDATFGGASGFVESNPNVAAGPEQIMALAINATHIFMAGYDNQLANDEQWRVEKRLIGNGNLEAAFDSDGILQINPSAGAGDERIMAIAIDATHIYLAGHDNAPGNLQWRIEKRDINTGALDPTFGAIVNNPSSGPDAVQAIALDDTYVYLAGYDSNGQTSSEQWRIEKRNKSDGDLVTSFGSPNGYVLRDHSTMTDTEQARDIAIDKDYIFIGGYGYLDGGGSDTIWQVECLNITDGTPITGFGANGTVKTYFGGQSAKINAMALDHRYLYGAGYNYSSGSERWRIGKLRAKEYLSSGDYTSAIINLGGATSNFNAISWQPVNQIASTAMTVDMRAGNSAVIDGSWTAWSTNVTNGGAPAGMQGKQYVQYKANLTSTATNRSPHLDLISLDFSNFPTGAGLESSVFDTGSDNNFLKDIAWSENLNGHDVRLQLATSADGINWDYCGSLDANCSTGGWLSDWNDVNNYFSVNTTNVPLPLTLVDAMNDRFFKYKVWLTGDGTGTPDADAVAITYDTAHLGVFANDGVSTTMAATAGSAFNVKIKVRDSSGATYNGHDHSSTIKLISSVPQYDQGSCTSTFTGNNNTEYTAPSGTFASGELTLSGITLCESTSTAFTISAVETFGGKLVSNSDLTVSATNVDSGSLALNFKSDMPTQGITNQDLSPDPVVEIRDQYGNLDVSATDSITISAKKDGGCATNADGTLSADSLSAAAVGGLATFTSVQYDLSEVIYISASAPGFSNICSAGIDVVGAGYFVKIESVYDLTNNSVDIVTSFLRQGAIVTGTITLSDMDILDSGDVSLVSGDLTTVHDTVNNVFHSTWAPLAGVSANTLYKITADIDYNGTTYAGLETIQVGPLGEIKQGLTELDTKITSIDANVDATNEILTPSDTQVDGVKKKLSDHAASQAAYRAQTTTKLASLKAEIGSILEDTSKTVPDLIKLTVANELARGTVSEIISTQAEVKTGATLPFRFRTDSGLSPVLTLYDPKNAARLASVPMKEVGGTGIYTFNIVFKEVWGLGRFMIRVDEPTNLAFDQIALKVVDGSKDKAKTQTTVSTSAISLDTLFSRVNKIDSTVTALSSGVNTVKANTSGVSTDINDLLESLDKKKSGTSADGTDAAEFGKYISAVSSIIGTSSSTTDFRTIMGKLNGIEGTLGSMGIEANAASSFNTSAKEKAARIKRFVNLIMMEIKEEGEVADAEEKAEILEDYLTDLKVTVEEIPNNVTTEGITESVQTTLEELDQITLGKEGLEGITTMVEEDLSLEVVDAQPVESLSEDDMQAMRNDVSGLKSLMLEIRGLLDEEVNAPVVHGWLEGI